MSPKKYRYRIKVPAGFYEGAPEHVEVQYATIEELERGVNGIIAHTMVEVLSRDLSTGLKDKNGVEIYEGDIVERIGGLNKPRRFEVIWNDLDLRWEIKEFGSPGILKNDPLAPGMAVKTTEVIGNIYENAELLK